MENISKACLRRLGPSKDYKMIPLESEEVVIGRARDVTYNIVDLQISRKHAIFRFRENYWTVESVGMNGIVVNQVVLPKNEPFPINHMDIIEFGVGSKFMYSFRMQSNETYEPPVKKSLLLTCGKGPSAKDTKAFHSWVHSKKILEKTLMEENEVLDRKLMLHSSLEEQITAAKQEIENETRRCLLALETQFNEEKKQLETKVASGELEKIELQKEKEILKQQMENKLQEVTDESTRKTLELEKKLSEAHADKQIVLEQKEIVVQQLQREKKILEDRLNEERQASAAIMSELAKLRDCREKLEEQLAKERQMFEAEKRKLVEQGSESELRLHQLQNERHEREKLLESTRAELHCKEKELADIQSHVSIGLDMIETIQLIQKESENNYSNNEIVMVIHSSNSNVATSDAEIELQRVREELQASLAEKEKILKELEGASAKARQDAVGRLEDVVENELQCVICSELFVMATTLNCSHVFCSYCIGEWKKKSSECPICRAPVVTETRSIVIDSAIDGIVRTLSEDVQTRRSQLIQQRRQLEARAQTEIVSNKTINAAAESSSLNRRSRNRGRVQTYSR